MLICISKATFEVSSSESERMRDKIRAPRVPDNIALVVRVDAGGGGSQSLSLQESE